MTSAFIVGVQPQLQPDPNEETAALLRVLIYKVDNTTFGGDVPALPQWTGPPRTVIQVQSILYASLVASLFSAFLAMLGKQWLNRYASIDMRGSAIERSQNRQRKLDGIVVWYFNHVLESLPLMLQLALLLLGSALSRYLWEINITVASVVAGVTSLGVLFYLFVVVAGATSKSCPYQTPWTNTIRRLSHLLVKIYPLFIKHSFVYKVLFETWGESGWCEVFITVLSYPIALLLAFAVDGFYLGQATLQALAVFVHGVHSRSFGASPIPKRALDNQATELDFRCISWMLHTSLDKIINLSTLNFLGTILPPSGLSSLIDPDVAVGCFNIFLSCFVTDNNLASAVTRGSEQLAGISTTCFLRTLSCLPVMGSSFTATRDMRRRYRKVFRHYIDLRRVPRPATVGVIHHLFTRSQERPRSYFRRYNPSFDELAPIAHALARVAQIEYHGRWIKPKVPRWLLRFALRFLSQDPLPPKSVVIDCLTIIATDLGCNVPDLDGMESDEKYFFTPKYNQFFTNTTPVRGMINFLLQ